MGEEGVAVGTCSVLSCSAAVRQMSPEVMENLPRKVTCILALTGVGPGHKAGLTSRSPMGHSFPKSTSVTSCPRRGQPGTCPTVSKAQDLKSRSQFFCSPGKKNNKCSKMLMQKENLSDSRGAQACKEEQGPTLRAHPASGHCLRAK